MNDKRVKASRAAAWAVLCALCVSAVGLRAAGDEEEEGAIGRTTTVEAILPPKNPLPPEEESAEVGRFSFLVYGDTRGRRDGEALQYEHWTVVRSMLETIKKERNGRFPVRFILQTGDAVVNGRDSRQWNISFVDLINRLTQDGGVPYFLAPGNHDVTSSRDLDSAGRQKGLRNYLEAVSRLIPRGDAPRRLAGYPTYAFGFGNSFFIAMDSNVAWDPVQYDWIRGQLEGLDRNRYEHVFAFFHHPPFSSGPHGASKVEPAAESMRARYMPLFRKYHFDAVFAGHEHLFEHWVERYQDENGQRRRLDQIVTGGGGAPLYPYRGEPDLTSYLDRNKAEKVTLEHLVKPGLEPGDNPYHYVVVRVDGSKLSMEVIGVEWGRDFAPYRSSGTMLTDPR